MFKSIPRKLRIIGPAPAFATLSSLAGAQSVNFNYSTATEAANQTGWGQYIQTFGGIFLYACIILGVIGVAWSAVELMFFDKEFRDVKKTLIGGAILIIGPTCLLLGINYMTASASV